MKQYLATYRLLPSLLMFLCSSYVAFIANNMDPDQTAPP